MFDAKLVADLQVRAMMFDMCVDWETLELVPKVQVQEDPFWLTRWKEKRDQSDFDEYIDIDKE